MATKFKVGDRVKDVFESDWVSNPDFGEIGIIYEIDAFECKHVKFKDTTAKYSFDSSLQLANSDYIKEKLGIK